MFYGSCSKFGVIFHPTFEQFGNLYNLAMTKYGKGNLPSQSAIVESRSGTIVKVVSLEQNFLQRHPVPYQVIAQ